MDNLQHRKAEKRLILKDKNGNALASQKVSVKQIRRDFLFGVNGFDTLAYTNVEDEEKRAFYKDRVEKALEIFNYMTIPVYWGTFEPEEGKPETVSRMNAAKFLKEKGVIVKGHPLCWHTVCADWLLKYDDETIMKKQLERIRREVTEFKGLIDYWDVINETVIMPVFDKYDNAVTRICNRYGRIPLIKSVFEEAFESNPQATLLLNDFNTTPEYEKVIEECLDAGIKINALGIQSHQHQGYWGVEKIYDVLERFSKYNLPIHFTENTMISGDFVPDYIEDLNDWQVEEWPTTEEGEARQAREMEEMYRILFADKNVKAISWWDFADGMWLGAPSGVVRKDGSLKPVYHKMKDLVKEWSTEYETMTDEYGGFTLSGYKGSYEIITNNCKKVVDLCDNTITDDTVLYCE